MLYDPSINIDKNALSKLKSLPGRFHIVVNKAHFEFFFKEEKKDWLYIFLDNSPFKDVTVKNKFSRWSWQNLFDGHMLCVKDPMHFTHEGKGLRAGWFFGTREEDFCKYLADIIKKIAKIYSIPNSHIVVYGSSASATAAMSIVRHIKRSISVSINPQFLSTHIAYPKENFEEVTGMQFDDPELADRFDNAKMIKSKTNYNILVINCISKMDYRPVLNLCNDLGVNPVKGITHKDNLVLWVYEAYGNPDPHIYWDSRTVFKALNLLITSIADSKNDEEVDKYVEDTKKYYDVFGDFWFDASDAMRKSEMRYVDALLNSSKPSDWEKAFKICESYVKFEYSGAMTRLGRMYRDGIYVKKDSTKATRLLIAAAKGGDPVGGNWLVDMLISDTSADIRKEAYGAYLKLAEKGNEDAKGIIARMYLRGIHVKKDMNIAIDWLRKANEWDASWVRFKLAQILIERGLPEDQDEAYSIFAEFAKKGNKEAIAVMEKRERSLAEKNVEQRT